MRRKVEEIYRCRHTYLFRSRKRSSVLRQIYGQFLKKCDAASREDLRRAGRGNEAFLALTTV